MSDGKKTLLGVEPKDIMGVVGLAGDLYAAWSSLPGKYVILIGLICSLFLLIWGWLTRRSASTLLKAVALTSVIVGVSALLYFFAVGLTLALSDPPSQLGRKASEEMKEFYLTGDQTTSRVSGSHALQFTHTADAAEVGLLPSPEDAALVRDMSVTKILGAPGQLDRVGAILNKTSGTQAYYEIKSPSPDFHAVFEMEANLKQSAGRPVVRMRAYYKYGQRDWLWRVQRWVFEHYGESSS